MSESRTLPAALFAVILSTLCCGHSTQMTATDDQDLANKTNIFINGLKQTLKNNNDDYIELRAATNRQTHKADIDKLYYKKITRNTLGNNNIININSKNSARRFEYSNNEGEPGAPTDTTMKHNDYGTPTKENTLKKVNNMQETLEKFLQKNERLLRNYLSSRNMQSSTRNDPSLSPLPLIVPSVNKNKGLVLSFLSSKIPSSIPNTSLTPPSYIVTPSSPSSEDMYGRGLRQFGRSDEDKSEPPRVPEVEQLDMAWARGTRLHNLRLKGRLCQRSVLFPEGPKYNREGAVYIRAHDRRAVGGRDFAQTRAPKYILPRCCNCCKKSVLGCQ